MTQIIQIENLRRGSNAGTYYTSTYDIRTYNSWTYNRTNNALPSWILQQEVCLLLSKLGILEDG